MSRPCDIPAGTKVTYKDSREGPYTTNGNIDHCNAHTNCKIWLDATYTSFLYSHQVILVRPAVATLHTSWTDE